jgi:hypothetical protein
MARAARDRVNGHLVNEIANGHAMPCLGQEKLIPGVRAERKRSGRHPHADIHRKIPSEGVMPETACLARGGKAFVVKWELKSSRENRSRLLSFDPDLILGQDGTWQNQQR